MINYFSYLRNQQPIEKSPKKQQFIVQMANYLQVLELNLHPAQL